MQLLVKILIIVGIIILIPLIIALFVKREYQVQREIVIDRPLAQVFDYLKYLKNQDSYNPWIKMDPAMKKEFSGTDGTSGFVYAWEGDKSGKGEQEIIRIQENKQVDIELRFIKPFKSRGQVHFATRPLNANQTGVSWAMEGKNPYPMNIMNLCMNNMLGKDISKGLADLKSVLER